MNKTIIATTLATAFSFGIASQAQAKDPYNTISDLSEHNTLSVVIQDSKKLGIKGSSTVEKVNIQHRGYTEIELFSSEGSTAIATEFGSDDYAWEDESGFRYVLENYPEDNDGASVVGRVLFGKTKVGKFKLSTAKYGVHKASGRWVGVLAFPGGSQLPLGLQISSIPQALGNGCVEYSARVNFPGHAYEQTSLYKCSGDKNMYGSGFFYADSVSGRSWFISLNVLVESGQLQGDVHTFALDGEGSSLGKVLTERPTEFTL